MAARLWGLQDNLQHFSPHCSTLKEDLLSIWPLLESGPKHACLKKNGIAGLWVRVKAGDAQVWILLPVLS